MPMVRAIGSIVHSTNQCRIENKAVVQVTLEGMMSTLEFKEYEGGTMNRDT